MITILQSGWIAAADDRLLARNVQSCPSKSWRAVLRNGELDLGDIDVMLAARSLSTQHDRRDGPDTRYHFDADEFCLFTTSEVGLGEDDGRHRRDRPRCR